MWHDHYEKLYNSVHDIHCKNLLYSRFAECNSDDKGFQLTVQCMLHDIVECISRQKSGKVAGLDGVPMEAIIHGGHKLYVHLCFLFNLFLKVGYLCKL